MLEKVQRRASEFILGDSEYQQRLTDIQLLPLMMIFELNDIMFFVNRSNFHLANLIYLIMYLLTITPSNHLHISS